MRRKILSAMLIITLTVSTCGIALAAGENEGTAGKELKSYGRIAYQEGDNRVVIDSEDFHMLADRLDLFKRGVADQLNSINTYFTTEEGVSLKTNTDIRVVHTRPSGDDSVDPLTINFDTLLEGIAASQSVPLNVAAASSDNLTSGTAAWVDGHLILGTGADNQAAYEEGYRKGIASGSGKSYRNVKLPTTATAGSVTYTVPEDMKDVIIYYYSRLENVTMNFSPAVEYQVLVQSAHDIESGRVCNVIYIPELKSGTVLTYFVSATHRPVLFYK